MENKGEIDPDFPLKDYQPHLNNVFSNSKYSSKTSISMMMLSLILSKMKFKRAHF